MCEFLPAPLLYMRRRQALPAACFFFALFRAAGKAVRSFVCVFSFLHNYAIFFYIYVFVEA